MSVSPNTPEQDLQWRIDHGGLTAEQIQATTEGEVARRRKLISGPLSADGVWGGGFAELPPDKADIAFRDAGTGAIRKARSGSTRSAILGSFSPTAPLGKSAITGGA